MPNLASVLKEEIRRLARKEVAAAITPARKQIAQHRRELAAIKRENQALKKSVAYLQKKTSSSPVRSQANRSQAKAAPPGVRFSARSLKAQRRRSGLTQAEYASLIGVSAVSLHHWENGNNRPRDKHLAQIVALRGMGKRDAERRLGEID